MNGVRPTGPGVIHLKRPVGLVLCQDRLVGCAWLARTAAAPKDPLATTQRRRDIRAEGAATTASPPG
eukprot:6672418-Alexandrium_andersonii.AAC.1